MNLTFPQMIRLQKYFYMILVISLTVSRIGLMLGSMLKHLPNNHFGLK
jgi:hypothetical protein